MTKNLFRTSVLIFLFSITSSCDTTSSDDQKSEYSDKIESATLLKTTKS